MIVVPRLLLLGALLMGCAYEDQTRECRASEAEQHEEEGRRAALGYLAERTTGLMEAGAEVPVSRLRALRPRDLTLEGATDYSLVDGGGFLLDFRLGDDGGDWLIGVRFYSNCQKEFSWMLVQ